MNQFIQRVRMVFLAAAVTFVFIPAARAQSEAGTLYKAKCAGCHGQDGSGSTPAGKAMGAHDLHSPEIQKESDSDLAAVITNGKNKMPAYDKKLKPAEIDGLVAYIRTLAKK
jgi:cytochrome c6